MTALDFDDAEEVARDAAEELGAVLTANINHEMSFLAFSCKCAGIWPHIDDNSLFSFTCS